jgi:hypothetical protein
VRCGDASVTGMRQPAAECAIVGRTACGVLSDRHDSYHLQVILTCALCWMATTSKRACQHTAAGLACVLVRAAHMHVCHCCVDAADSAWTCTHLTLR